MCIVNYVLCGTAKGSIGGCVLCCVRIVLLEGIFGWYWKVCCVACPLQKVVLNSNLEGAHCAVFALHRWKRSLEGESMRSREQ